MLTLRGVFKDSEITLSDQVPFTGEYHVLVTFLDADVVVLSRDQHTHLIEHGLSPRELELLRYMKSGKTAKEIATVLGISEGTIRNHLSSIYNKLQVRNKTEALRKMMELKLL